jgi:hypothetical protein
MRILVVEDDAALRSGLDRARTAVVLFTTTTIDATRC